MRKIGWMVVGGVIVLAVQATSVADDSLLDLFGRGADCSKGTVQGRLDCLTLEVELLKRRMNGEDGRVLPVGPR